MILSFILGINTNVAAAFSKGYVEFDLLKNVQPGKEIVDVVSLADNKLISATLDNEQVYYQIQLGIGSPPQQVDFTIDTGSSDLWVMAVSNPFCTTDPLNNTGINCTGSIFDPLLSNTFHPLHEDFEIGYGDTTGAKGGLAKDTVTIGGQKLLNATFAVANISNATNCVFGIGFVGDEAQAVIHKNGTGVYPTYFNIPTIMKQQNLIHTNAYSLWLNDNRAEHGHILFGGIDTTKYEGDLHVMPVFNNYHEYLEQPVQMRVMLNGISANNKPLVDFNIAVLMDSGTSFAYLPKGVVEPLGNALGFTYEESVGYYYGGIDTAHSNVNKLTLNFSGAPIDVSIDNLLVGLTEDDGSPLIIDGEEQVILAVGVAEENYMNILGDVFLRGIYTVFDLDHYEIAVAKAKVNVTSSNVKTIDASIPNAVPVPNYASTKTNNDIFKAHSYTLHSTPASINDTFWSTLLTMSESGNASVSTSVVPSIPSRSADMSLISTSTGSTHAMPSKSNPVVPPQATNASTKKRTTTSSETGFPIASNTGLLSEQRSSMLSSETGVPIISSKSLPPITLMSYNPVTTDKHLSSSTSESTKRMITITITPSTTSLETFSVLSTTTKTHIPTDTEFSTQIITEPNTESDTRVSTKRITFSTTETITPIFTSTTVLDSTTTKLATVITTTPSNSEIITVGSTTTLTPFTTGTVTLKTTDTVSFTGTERPTVYVVETVYFKTTISEPPSTPTSTATVTLKTISTVTTKGRTTTSLSAAETETEISTAVSTTPVTSYLDTVVATIPLITILSEETSSPKTPIVVTLETITETLQLASTTDPTVISVFPPTLPATTSIASGGVFTTIFTTATANSGVEQRPPVTVTVTESSGAPSSTSSSEVSEETATIWQAGSGQPPHYAPQAWVLAPNGELISPAEYECRYGNGNGNGNGKSPSESSQKKACDLGNQHHGWINRIFHRTH